MTILKRSVLDAIGHVPTICLNQISTLCHTQELYLKLESCNPGGSIKEKNAVFLIELAEDNKLLKPGGTIIESSSGNFGISIAMVAAQKGYKSLIVVDAKTSDSSKLMMQAYGAQLVEVPLSAIDENGSMQKARIEKAKELERQISNSWYPLQHFNPDNPTAHIKYTASEIIKDFNGPPDVIVLGVSTSGQLTGIGSFFKKHYPKTKIIAVDVAGSVVFGGRAHPYKMVGVGLSFVPPQFNVNLIDKAYYVNDVLAFSVCRELALKEGLLLGGSTGAIVAAGLSYAQTLNKKQKILMINPDRGDRYLFTIYNDTWLKEQNLTLLKGAELYKAMHSLTPVSQQILHQKGSTNEVDHHSKNDHTVEGIHSSFHQ